MEGILILLAVFAISRAILRRQSRRETAVNWQEAAECEAELTPPEPIVLPAMEERIDSCYETLAQCQEEWTWHQAHERLNHHPADDAELVDLLYSRNRMHRANIFKAERRYVVQYENLYLIEEDTLHYIYRPGMSCGDWLYDGGESWFDSLDDARDAAAAVMKRMR